MNKNPKPNPIIIKSIISQGVVLVQWLEHPTGVAKVIGSFRQMVPGYNLPPC